jgi:hypothetical protein
MSCGTKGSATRSRSRLISRTVRLARPTSTASESPTFPMPSTAARAVRLSIRCSSALVQSDIAVIIGHVTGRGRSLPYNPARTTMSGLTLAST